MSVCLSTVIESLSVKDNGKEEGEKLLQDKYKKWKGGNEKFKQK
jgi:hypothetical protein